MDTPIQQLTRKERERRFKRQEIVRAAREVFALRGFNAATLDEIAERAEFGKGTLYSYFQSKDELFENVLADIIDEFIEIAARTCTDPKVGIRESYLGFARALLEHLFANFGIYYLLMREIHKMEHQSHFTMMFPDLLLLLAEPLKRNLPADAAPGAPGEQLGFLWLTMILSLFRSSLNSLGQPHCAEQVPELDLTPEVIASKVEESLGVLELAFFDGIMSMTHKGN
jgi:AcrR family transcriptional regulator